MSPSLENVSFSPAIGFLAAIGFSHAIRFFFKCLALLLIIISIGL